MGNTAVHSQVQNYGKRRRNWLPNARRQRKPVTYFARYQSLQDEVLAVTYVQTLRECGSLVYQVYENDDLYKCQFMKYVDPHALVLSSQILPMSAGYVEPFQLNRCCWNIALEGAILSYFNTVNLGFSSVYSLKDFQTPYSEYVNACKYLPCEHYKLCLVPLLFRSSFNSTALTDGFDGSLNKERLDNINIVSYTIALPEESSGIFVSTSLTSNSAIPFTICLRAIPEVIVSGAFRNDSQVIVWQSLLPLALSTLWYQLNLRVVEGTLARLLLLQLYQVEVGKMDQVDFADWTIKAGMRNTATCFEVCQYESANYRIDGHVGEVEQKYKVLLTLGDCERCLLGTGVMSGDSTKIPATCPPLTRELRVYGADCGSIQGAVRHFVAKLNQIKTGQFYLPNGDSFTLNNDNNMAKWITPQTLVCTADPLIKLRGFRVIWS